MYQKNSRFRVWFIGTNLHFPCYKLETEHLHAVSVRLYIPMKQVSKEESTKMFGGEWLGTTPPPTDSFFDVFVKQVQERNKKADYFFFLENHSLACPQCIEGQFIAPHSSFIRLFSSVFAVSNSGLYLLLAAQEPEKCAHRLHLVPPWKSMLRFARMKALIPSAHSKDFATEVYGVLGSNVHFYIPKKVLDRARELPRQFRTPRIEPTDPVYVSIDPASHDKSDMGISAMIIASGHKIFLGASTIGMEKCMVQECQLVVSAFLQGIRDHPFVKATMPILPIVECNNNEIIARSILECFKPFGPIHMVFTKDRFQTAITEGVGVWITQTIKMAMIQTTYQALLDDAIRFSGQFVVTGRGAFNPKAPAVSYAEQIETLLTQLGQFKDQPDGRISGKSASGDNDDLGISAMMCIYWSFLIRSLK